MKRRDFLAVVGFATLAGAVTAVAQQSERKRLVAVALALEEHDKDGERSVGAFQQALQELGWAGDNLRVEYRWGATTPERARAISAELLRLHPDVIVSHATIVTRAFSQATKTIPIVFTNVSDPLGEKFVQSFAKPGGNITGFTNIERTMGAKYLQLLKDVAPDLTRAAMLFNPKSAPGGGSYFTDSFEAAAPQFSMQPIKAPVQDAAGIEKVVSALANGGGGLIVVGEPFTNAHRAGILELTSRYRIPTVCPYTFYATNGCLLSYGVDLSDQFRRAAAYVDRILKGTATASLPVQSPVKFELAINVKTARSLGLSIPPTLLARADEVIE
ncbi:MAG TPA: ABC transporter substrate-binding protein [Pseudolabrys sp.]|jgi:putative ABC transport system substrate-binding protein